MRLESKKYLYDIARAADLIRRFTKGKAFADFEDDEMMRSAVERQFEIIGEALNKLVRADAETATRISEHHHIIAFRNILIHGYAEIDRRLVWGVVESKLGVLADEVNAVGGELLATPPPAAERELGRVVVYWPSARINPFKGRPGRAHGYACLLTGAG